MKKIWSDGEGWGIGDRGMKLVGGRGGRGGRATMEDLLPASSPLPWNILLPSLPHGNPQPSKIQIQSKPRNLRG